MEIHLYETDQPLTIITHRSGKADTKVEVATHIVEVWDGTNDGWGRSLHF